MPRTRENIAAHELVGTEIRVITASDATLNGVTGCVRDETRNVLKVEVTGKVKTIPKAGTTFEARTADEDYGVLNGAKLAFRPEDRVKKGVERRP